MVINVDVLLQSALPQGPQGPQGPSGASVSLENISSNLIPSANEVYSIGTDSLRWANIYLAANTIVLGTVALSADDGQLILPSTVKIGNATIDGSSGGNVNTSEAATGGVPKIGSIVYPGDDTAADPAGNQVITLIGSGFKAGAKVILDNSIVSVVSVVSDTEITFVSPAKATGGYILYVVNTDGGTAIAIPGMQYSGIPEWSTAAGSLGSVYETEAINYTVSANSDTAVSYSVTSGALPPNISIGASTGSITGTANLVNSSTTYNFTVDATDQENQNTSRSFNITVNPDVISWVEPANAVTTVESFTLEEYSVSLDATSLLNSTITYTANTLPGNLSLSGNTISGQFSDVAGNTSVLITATTTETQKTSTRQLDFIITVKPPPAVTYFIVGGGGGGGPAVISGGGGGVLSGSGTISPGVTYDIVVGAGSTNYGPGRGGDSYIRSQSDSSYIGGTVAYGGGNGGYAPYPPTYIAGQTEGANGGSGGGAGANNMRSETPGGKGVYPGSSFVSADRQGYDGVASYYYIYGAGGGAANSSRGSSIQGIYGSHYGGNGINVPAEYVQDGVVYASGAPQNERGVNSGAGGGDSGIVMLRSERPHVAISGTYTITNQAGGWTQYTFTGSGTIRF
jgi:hypothetical protein